MSRNRIGAGWAGAAVLAAAVGCGDAGPKLYPVKGRVSFEDGTRVGHAKSVTFRAESDPASVAGADLEPDGTFELYHVSGRPGAAAGAHKVILQTERPEWGEKRAAGPLGKYLSFDTTDLTATVEPGSDNYVEIKVKRDRK